MGGYVARVKMNYLLDMNPKLYYLENKQLGNKCDIIPLLCIVCLHLGEGGKQTVALTNQFQVNFDCMV